MLLQQAVNVSLVREGEQHSVGGVAHRVCVRLELRRQHVTQLSVGMVARYMRILRVISAKTKTIKCRRFIRSKTLHGAPNVFSL